MAVLDGDVLRVTCNFELGDGTQYQNVFHYVRDGTDPYSDAVHIAAIKAEMEATYATIAALVLSDVTEQLSFVDRVEFNEIVDEWRVVENIGTFTPDFTPTETARPRSVGKKFLFPFSEAQQAETILIGGAVTAMAAFGTAILSGMSLGGDATLTACIVRTGVQTVLNLLVAVINDVIGSQKRRRPGVGA